MPDPSTARATPAPPGPPPRAVSVAQMQRIDAAAIGTFGIPRLLLMEHAGLAVARAAERLSPNRAHPIAVCCGTGFNGGDGLAAARHLHERGYPLRLWVAGPFDRLRGEPAIYATILRRLGLTLAEYADGHQQKAARELSGCGLIIDALLGIGARGVVREPVASLIELVNRAGKPVVAVDLPSGLDGDTGRAQGVAVNATVTVTFGLPKRGCFLEGGPAHTGELIVDPVTFPRALLEAAP